MKIKIKQSQNWGAALLIHQEMMPTDEFDLRSNSILWLAYVDDEPVGYATAVPNMEESFYFLSGCAVLSKVAGNGIQKKLIKARERHAKKAGIAKLITYTVVDNPKSINSLISQGFKSYTPAYKWVGNQLYWYKNL